MAAANSKRIARGRRKRRPPPTAIRWKIIAAATAAAVIVVAIGGAPRFSQCRPRHGGEQGSSGCENEGQRGLGTGRRQERWHAGAQAQPADSGSAWENAWADAKRQADRLLAERRFAKAIHEYAALADRFQDPLSQQQCHEAIQRIEAEADAAYEAVEAVARQYLGHRQFIQARAALQPALTTYGPVPASHRAGKLLAEIEHAEKQVVSLAGKAHEAPNRPQTPAVPAELLKQRKLEATYAKTMATIESRVAGWDFQGAVQDSGEAPRSIRRNWPFAWPSGANKCGGWPI